MAAVWAEKEKPCLFMNTNVQIAVRLANFSSVWEETPTNLSAAHAEGLGWRP